MPRRFRRRFSYDTPTDGTPDIAPASVDLVAAEPGASSYCGRCAYFVAPGELGDEGACTIVEGAILPEQVCALFTARTEPTDAEQLPTPPPLPEAEAAPVAEVVEVEVEVEASGALVAAGGFLLGEPLDLLPLEGEGIVQMSRVAVLIREGEESSDGRYIEPGALDWRDLPLTMTINHDPDQRPAVITHIGRTADLAGLEAVAAEAVAAGEVTAEAFAAATGDTGDYIAARIEFDSEWLGMDTAREVEVGLLRGVSIEIGNEDADYLETTDGEVIYVVHAGRIGAATLTPFQAIESARVLVPLADHDEDELPTVEDITEVLASAAVASPPAAWFADPGLDGPTPITVDPDGHVFGHLALWGTCHIGRPGVCVTPPHSESGYAHFLKPAAVLCDDGTSVAAGKITLGTGHAPVGRGVTAQAAADHYDHTGSVVADTMVGEDEHGIWMAGRLRPDADELRVQQLRAADLSGDWRPIEGTLELVAALAVNVPGFPVRPTQAVVASGAQVALFAGTHLRDGAEDCGCDGGSSELAAEVRRLSAIVDTLGLAASAADAVAQRITR